MNNCDDITVLIVDDEETNLYILEEYLINEGYAVVKADCGERALDLLYSNNYAFSAILLDRMMPGMNGFEVLYKIRENPMLKNIPVIFQTGATSSKDVLDGMKAGAYYYLTKPFDPDLMITVVRSAIADYQNLRNIVEEKDRRDNLLRHISSIKLSFRTIEEARNIAAGLALLFPDTEKALLGLTEIFINGVEHGNLEISYDEKSVLLKNKTWQQEIEKRQQDGRYQHRLVDVELSRSAQEISVLVSDQGNGFDWQDYMELQADRISLAHGRGIALANAICFDSMDYLGNGNAVKCVVKR